MCFGCSLWDFSGKALWIPSRIEFIVPEGISACERLKSVVFENGSKLEQIDSRVFSKTGLKFVTIPGSVEVLGKECFSGCRSARIEELKQVRYCHELKRRHSLELV
jgi:hypothetical protein